MGVWVNGLGDWVQGTAMGDRTWYEHIVDFAMPADGQTEIVIRFRDRWGSRAFFIDRLRLQPLH